MQLVILCSLDCLIKIDDLYWFINSEYILQQLYRKLGIKLFAIMQAQNLSLIDSTHPSTGKVTPETLLLSTLGRSAGMVWASEQQSSTC